MCIIASGLFTVNLVKSFIQSWFQSYDKYTTSLRGKTAIITGAGSGLGKACAIHLYKHGCNVILCGRTLSTLEDVCNEINNGKNSDSDNNSTYCQSYCIDLSQTNDVIHVTDKILQACNGKVDILINNAGLRFRGDILSTDLNVFQTIFSTNFFGQVALTKALLPSMIGNGSGHIVGIGSVQVILNNICFYKF